MIEPTQSEPVSEPPDEQTNLSDNGGVIRAARMLAIGNIVGRMLGLLSTAVMNAVFGATLVAAYEKAAWIPLSLRDLLVGGLVDSALVPVFNDLAQEEGRERLWAGVSAFLSVLLVVLLAITVLVEIFFRPIAYAVGVYEFSDPELIDISLKLMRLGTPAVIFLGFASALTSVLYALKRFTIPAFLTTVFNGMIALAALLRPDDVTVLVYGLLVGSFLQVVIQLPALRDAKLRWNLNFKHPVLRRIIKLYLPVVGGLLISQAVIALSYNLATRTGDASQTYMRNGTRLIQFPDGLVVTAISIAVLPTLTQQANGKIRDFLATLAAGIRLVLVLILPATVGLFVLAHPIVDLLFGNGQYNAFDVSQTAQVLRVYLLGLPFAGVDRMLIFAFYARQDTWRPALVGVITILVNAAIAIALINVIGLFSLMVADVVKHVLHTAIMLWLLWRHVGKLEGFGVMAATLKALAAALATGGVAYAISRTLQAALPATTLSEAIVVATSGLAGVGVYIIFVYVLDIREVKDLLKRRPTQV